MKDIASIRYKSVALVVVGAAAIAVFAGLKFGALPAVPAVLVLALAVPALFVMAVASMPSRRPAVHASPWDRSLDERSWAASDERATVASAAGHRRTARRPVWNRSSDETPPPAAGERRESEGKRVLAWRHERLTDLGLDAETALLLAGDSAFSVHELERLLESGCPVDTALRIVWPV